MVVDPDATGYFGGPLTARRAVATLSALQRTEGTVPFATGALSRIDRGTLDIMAVELIGYSGSELADDAQAFARAELGYSSQGLPVDTSYAGQLTADIAALERDCPPIHGHNHAHGN